MIAGDTQLKARPKDAGRQAEPQEATARALIIDDEMHIREMLRRMLKRTGYAGECAGNAEDALALLDGQEFDLVLTDLRMPGMDGIELVRVIRERNAHLPIIVVTGLSDAKTAVELIHNGADDYVVKPFDYSSLLWTIERVSEHHRLQRENERYQEELEHSLGELRRLEQERQHLTEMVVHDLKNPLAVVMARLEMLQLAAEDLGERQTRSVRLAGQSAREMLNLIMDLLDISRHEAGEKLGKRMQLEEIAPNDFLNETLEQWRALAEASRIDIQVKMAPDLPTVAADPELLKRVVGNLLSNAFSHSGDNSEVELLAEASDDAVVFGVRDHGKGIAPEWQDRIFDKYSQVEAREQGQRLSRGLGLTFCRLAVETMGGKIWVESKVGEGATFRFRLPRQNQ
jgi:signal transduction histidine kinase